MDGITLVLLIALAVSIVLGRSRRFLFRMSEATNIPGPAPWPIIGNVDFFLGVNNVERALQAFTKMVKAYDAPLNRIWLGPKLVILVKSPKYIDALLTHKAAVRKDDVFYNGVKEATGDGIVTKKGVEWQRMRKPTVSLLQPKNINNFQEIICQKVDSMCQELEVKTNTESFDISPYIKLCSLEVICEAGMGMDNIKFIGDDKFGAIHQFEKEIEYLILNIWGWQSLLGLTKYNRSTFLKRIGQNLSRVVYERKMQLESLGINYMTDFHAHEIEMVSRLHAMLKRVKLPYIASARQLTSLLQIDEPKNYIDIVLRTGEFEQKDEYGTAIMLLDFFVAGADTQSIVIIVLLYLLAMHQEYQEKVHEELLDIFGHSDRDPQEDDLRRMVYLDMCLKEAIRHCSPPAVARAVDEDIQIDGYIIPKGAALLFALYLAHEDPQFWERPGEFFPDHFQPDAVAKRPKGSFLPFVAGPRMCPGQQYSFQSMKTVVSTLLRRYHFTTDQKYSELKYKYLLMREPVNPLVKISKRLPDTKSLLF